MTRAPLWLAKACDKMQGQITSGTSSVSQKAAEAALNGGLDSIMKMKAAFLKRRDIVLNLMKDIPGWHPNQPEGAFYVFSEVSHYFGKTDGEHTITNASDLCMFLLYKAHVSVVTGDAFGDPSCVRFSYAASDDRLIEAIRRIKEALKTLK